MSSFVLLAIMRLMVQAALPIDQHVSEIVAHVRRARTAVVVAPPGAGKTTRLPPALAELGRTILLQPRRVAARALARRIAAERGWSVGEEIGWQIRFERRFSARGGSRSTFAIAPTRRSPRRCATRVATRSVFFRAYARSTRHARR